MNALLTRQQCNAARALAIVGIMLHNYCHAFDFAIQESEFELQVSETMRWVDYLHHIDSNLFVHLFSCWGYMGVGVFMFLGAYGLVRKYEAGGAPLSPGSFIVKQWRKLLALVLVPQLAFVAIQLVALHNTFATPWSILAQLGMVINPLLGVVPGIKIVPFPYWYLGMMMQLYVIYALLHRFQGAKARLWIPVALIATGYALHLFLPADSAVAGWLRYNSPVAFVAFGMGLLAGRYGKAGWLTARRAAILVPLMCICAVAGSINHAMWGLIYAIASVLVISVAVLLRGRLLEWAVKIGEVSALVYIIHPVTRFVVMLPSQKFFPEWVHTPVLVYILVTAVSVYLYRRLKIDTTVNRLICGNPDKKK